jgi:hypothetical protein
MNIKKILKAFFFHEEDPVELDLAAAEIREGKAFLHPKNEKGVTYLVRSEHIEITLSKGFSLSSNDVVRIEPKSNAQMPTNPNTQKQPALPTKKAAKDAPNIPSPPSEDPFEKYKKKQFSISLYPDEYEALMSHMKSYGYKRADFILACVNTATKGTMEREHKKIIKAHSELRKEEKALQNKQTTKT